MQKMLISLGSNTYSKSNIDKAKRMLQFIFPDIVFTSSILSLANESEGLNPFRNALGVFKTDMPIFEILPKLKAVEKALGRYSKDKITGKIVIDIDLLQCGENILRPDDYGKSFVQKLLPELKM